LLKRRILHRDYCSIGKIAIERKEQAGKDGLLFSGSTAILSLFIIPHRSIASIKWVFDSYNFLKTIQSPAINGFSYQIYFCKVPNF